MADAPIEVVPDLTDGIGADVVIEAVGVPESFELCTELVRPGGHVANIGVHGKPATLHLETLWIKNVTITTGLVDTHSTPTLLGMLAAEQIDTTQFVTHRFGIGEMLEAYDVFSQAADSGALKVALFRTRLTVPDDRADRHHRQRHDHPDDHRTDVVRRDGRGQKQRQRHCDVPRVGIDSEHRVPGGSIANCPSLDSAAGTACRPRSSRQAWWLTSSPNWRGTGRSGGSRSASPMMSVEPACRSTRR